jgi:hypothetical protein
MELKKAASCLPLNYNIKRNKDETMYFFCVAFAIENIVLQELSQS